MGVDLNFNHFSVLAYADDISKGCISHSTHPSDKTSVVQQGKIGISYQIIWY